MELLLPLREALLQDEVAFLTLWMDYLSEREKNGSLIAATNRNISHYRLLFRQLCKYPKLGVVVLAQAEEHLVGIGLYGPKLPLDATGNRKICIGNGTYVTREYRSKGVSRAIYDYGFESLKRRGFTHITGSVDVENEVGVASVLARRMDVVSLNFLREL